MKKFKRAMFGGMAKFSVPWRTPFWLCLALLVLAALTVINAVILMSAAAQSGLFLSTLQAHWDKLPALSSCMLAVAISFGALLFISDISKPQELSSFPGCSSDFSLDLRGHYHSRDSENCRVDDGNDPHRLAEKLWNHNGGTSSSWLACVRTWAEQLFEIFPRRNCRDSPW